MAMIQTPSIARSVGPLLRTVVALAVIAGAGAPLCAQGGEEVAASAWLEDLDAARAQAQREGKLVLTCFTGLDWCLHCQEFEARVCEVEAFCNEAAKMFVLVRLDDPQDPEGITVERRAAIRAEADRLGVRSYPTVVLTDAKGRPFARTGFRDDWAGYLAELVELEALGSEVAAARAAMPTDPRAEEARAQGWDRVLTLIGREVAMDCYPERVAQVLAADEDGSLGLASRYRAWQRGAEMQDLLLRHMGRGDWEGLVRDMDELAGLFRTAGTGTEDLLQKALFFRAAGQMELKDYSAARESYRAAAEAAPGTEMARIVTERFLPMVERALEGVEAQETSGDGK